jgi:hypothetical protein
MTKHVKPPAFVEEQRPGFRRHHRHFSRYWLIIAGGLLLLGVVLVQQDRSVPLNFKPEVTGSPRIAVMNDTLDHGDLKFNTPIQSVFAIGNVGDQELMIFGEPRVEVVEGCCPPRVELTSARIQPGGKVLLSMNYSMHEGMGGKHHFRVHIRTNDPVEPEKLLHIYSNWVS